MKTVESVAVVRERERERHTAIFERNKLYL